MSGTVGSMYLQRSLIGHQQDWQATLNLSGSLSTIAYFGRFRVFCSEKTGSCVLQEAKIARVMSKCFCIEREARDVLKTFQDQLPNQTVCLHAHCLVKAQHAMLSSMVTQH